MIQLKEWQQEAWDKFLLNKECGIIEASTGSGKTVLGLHLIKQNIPKKILIVVPTCVLLRQWHTEIQDKLKIYNIGLYGDGFKDERCITIAVVNSIRYLELQYDILICDEAHRYLSSENRKFLENNTFKKIMCLTATLKREDNLTYDFLNLKTIYTYNIKEAIENKDLCKYELINVAVSLNEVEKEEYTKQDILVKQLMPFFNNNIQQVFSPPWSYQKKQLRTAINTRKSIVNNARNKILHGCSCIKYNYQMARKIIVFCELISTAEDIKLLLEANDVNVVCYYGGKKDKGVINLFSKEHYVLITVKALDEGLNVKNCDTAVIISGNSSKRQAIQRVGRVLRAKDLTAQIYQFYCKNTVDEQYMRKRSEGLLGASKISHYNRL